MTARYRSNEVTELAESSDSHSVHLYTHKDIYEEIIEDFDASRISLGELRARFIPPRATAISAPNTVSTSYSSSSAYPPAESQSAECESHSVARLDESPQSSLEVSECDEACGTAVASNGNRRSSVASADVDSTAHSSKEDEKLPTLEQLLSDYNPAVQHLEPLMTRTFSLPALEELVLTNCKERGGAFSGAPFGDKQGFVVRLVRHLTRFRESDAPDSPTRLRRLDLRATCLSDGSSHVRLMRLLAPHVEILAARKPLCSQTSDQSSDWQTDGRSDLSDSEDNSYFWFKRDDPFNPWHEDYYSDSS